MKEQRGRGIRRKKEKISNCPNFFVIVQTTLSRRNLDSSSARLRGTKSSPSPFSPRGEPLSKEERNGESRGIFRDTRIMHTFQECPFVRGDASLLVRLPRCSFHSLHFSSPFEEGGSIFSRSELGIKMDSYCRLENSSKDRFHSKDASWNWIKWNKNRLLLSPSHVGKIQSSPESR